MAHPLRHEDLTFPGRAPIRVVQEVELTATPEEVWPLVADAAAWPGWFTGMTAAHYTTPEPHGVGSLRWVEVAGLKVSEQVLAFDVAACFAFTVIEADRPGLRAMVEVVTLASSATGTTVRYEQAVEPAGWLRPLTPVLRARLTKGLRAGLDGLAAATAGQRG